MNLEQFHQELDKLLYIEDHAMVDVILASIVANSLRIGDPVWLTIIGPSSGGKSQIIRPFAQAKPDLIHRLDDLTPNTLVSGTLGLEESLLGRIGKHGILSMDDLTVLFSKSTEERAAILSQFRMLYDGRFSKSFGNRKEAQEWTGYIGMIAGSTPSIYRYFAEVADMGERFISYRMRPMDKRKAVSFVTQNNKTSSQLNNEIAALIADFMPGLLTSLPADALPVLHPETRAAIQEVSEYMTLLRTPVHVDERSGYVDEIPEPEMPFRVMKQLTYLAVGMQCLLPDPTQPMPASMMKALLWTAYSLANDKRRSYIRAIAILHNNKMNITARNVSAHCGLHTDIVRIGLDQLQALGIIKLQADDVGEKTWTVDHEDMVKLVTQIEDLTVDSEQTANF